MFSAKIQFEQKLIYMELLVYHINVFKNYYKQTANELVKKQLSNQSGKELINLQINSK